MPGTRADASHTGSRSRAWGGVGADAALRRRKALTEAGVLLVGRWVPAGFLNNVARLIKYFDPSGCRLMFPVAVANRSMIWSYS